ncbi:MAG TPA: hypothetical protein PLP27_00065 [Crocinitomicaceae bacterium]|nr:hypothetical protein [Crocinitomicaceae bacterium]
MKENQNKIWQSEVDKFLMLADKNNVRMIMVGGGAVNFHGYQRHSADVDFWLDTHEDNLKKLLTVFNEMDYEISDFPTEVKEQKQNVSIKFSPADLNVELITKFDVNKPFDEAFENSEIVFINNQKIWKYHVLSLDDLVTSKVKAGRNKDLLDILELKKMNED